VSVGPGAIALTRTSRAELAREARREAVERELPMRVVNKPVAIHAAVLDGSRSPRRAASNEGTQARVPEQTPVQVHVRKRV